MEDQAKVGNPEEGCVCRLEGEWVTSPIYTVQQRTPKGELAAIIVATGSRFRMTLPPRYLRTNPAVWIHLLSHADKGKKEWRSEGNGPKGGAERRRPASHTPWS